MLSMKTVNYIHIEIMKNIYTVFIINYFFLIQLSCASSDVEIPVTANAMHFSSPTINCKIVFNINANEKSSFSSITINHKDAIIDIPYNELNIKKYSQLDSVRLYQIGTSDMMYLVIVDFFGKKRERHEDILFFDSKKYLKRVTAEVDATDKVKYVTKIKGEDEQPGINDK